ncbi:hypothetical protein SAMN05216359_1045 [Roseateles sp. YR242]|uniref:hypothetical protein n=1 Tax=Roseateles sp. YR242 TaxID=1855305 RepID=UPI0008B137E9|nr:hypothetical protein [Roseateles sp. YR242]SEK92677.1 hypothetical protein SAMN05216359_1045 [Roseateles sp. YR242]
MFTHITMNHFRAIKAWADAHGGEANLDIATFQLEVKANHRYYKLLPQFIHEQDGRLTHVGSLMPGTTAFIGWRPYAPRPLILATDKLTFKRAVAAAGLATPDHWLTAREARADFILKRSVGSFGYQLVGPYHQGEDPPVPNALTSPNMGGKIFAEAFIPGDILKVWYWGARPVHVQTQTAPKVMGNGVSTIEALIAERMGQFGEQWAVYREREQVLTCLAYQGVQPTDTLPEGTPVWFDYRYGRHFAPYGTSEAQDNAWHAMHEAQREQLLQAGAWLAQAIQPEMRVPMLCAMDGVIDTNGKVWWLELNSNPICPPNAYFEMFTSLFGTSSKPPDAAYARSVRVAPARPAEAAEAPA